MRKLFAFVIMCFCVCAESFSQKWDVISREYETITIRDLYEYETLNADSNTYSIVIDTVYRHKKIPNGNVPYVILNNYEIGNKCFVSGSIMLGFGLGVGLIGVPLLVSNESRESYNIGMTMTAIGGTLVSFSIPLMCFGDHIKRETNMVYSILK